MILTPAQPLVWAQLDDDGEIVALHSDEQEGYVPLFRADPAILHKLEMIKLGHESSYDACKDEIALSEVWALIEYLRGDEHESNG